MEESSKSFNDADLSKILADWETTPYPYSELGFAVDLVYAYKNFLVMGADESNSEFKKTKAKLNDYIQSTKSKAKDE